VATALELADLTAKRSARWGLNAEIHAGLDYAKPHAWAARLRAAGAAGLRYAARSDPALCGRAVALFGSAGRHARAPAGMHTEVSTLDAEHARVLLETRGVLVVPIPSEVPTVPPPRHR